MCGGACAAAALAPMGGARGQDMEQTAAGRLAMIDDLERALERFTAATEAAVADGRCDDRYRIVNGFEGLYSNVIRVVAAGERFPPGTLSEEIAAWNAAKRQVCPPPGVVEAGTLMTTPEPSTVPAAPEVPQWVKDSNAVQDQWRRELAAEADAEAEVGTPQAGQRPLTADEQRSVAEHQAELLRQETELLEFEQRFDLQTAAAAVRAALAAGDCAGREAAAANLEAKINDIQSRFSSWNEADLAAAEAALYELRSAPCPPETAAQPDTIGSTGTDPAPTGLGLAGGVGLRLVVDSQTWCDYGPTTPQTLTPGSPGSDPRDGPSDHGPGEDGAGDDPRDGPPPRPDVPESSDERTPEQQAAYTRWYDEAAQYWEQRGDSGGGDGNGGGPVITPAPENEDDDPRDAPEDEQDDPNDAPVVELIVKATHAAQTGEGQTAVGHQQIRLFPESVQNVALPSEGGARPQTDAGADPIGCTTDAEGNCTVRVDATDWCQHCGNSIEQGTLICPACDMPDPGRVYHVTIPVEDVAGWVVEVTGPGGVAMMQGAGIGHFVSTIDAGGRTFVGILADEGEREYVEAMLGDLLERGHILGFEENVCRDKQPGPPVQEPLMRGAGTWGQAHDDQWAIKRVGLTLQPDSAWAQLGPDPQPVTVAVIDTGLDWNHLDFSWDNIWKNPGETPDNGIDDDRNGYVDDVIGWDFMENTNRPWDHDGHGTLVAGIIAADGSNGEGIAGINPHARVMVLRALNAFGHTRASYIAEAIVYAADNGARVINLSVGGPQLTQVEAAAVAHARRRGAVVVVAAGNEGVNVSDFGMAGADGVIAVGATNLDDSHPGFSNWGAGVDIAAPGVDVLSLRARRTDTMLGIKDVPYEAGSAYVGADRRYYRISGTSFSAPIVAGVATLILSARPELTGEQVESILIQSAQDIQTPGVDQYSGAGMVDARTALTMDPAFRIDASIDGLEVVQGESGPVVRVTGVAGADRFASARLEVGRGESPTAFTPVAEASQASGVLGDIPAEAFRGAAVWTVRLVVAHAGGRTREARYVLDVGG